MKKGKFMIDAVVDEVLKEMGNAANEGIMATDDYMDAETGLLVCGKCHTRKEKRISFLGEEGIVCCLCRCAAEELEKAEKERKDRKIMEGISRLKSVGLYCQCTYGQKHSCPDDKFPEADKCARRVIQRRKE